MIGNDVVDLREAETYEGAQHRGFDRRVFGAAERDAIAHSRNPRRLRWMLWAAKEAAYKALRRENPGFVFSPRALAVDLDEAGCGSVTGDAKALELRVEADAVRVVALAKRPEVARETLSVHSVTVGESRAATRAALGEDLRGEASRRGLGDDAVLEREGRIPILRLGTQRFPVSIAHHGRLAHAFVLWQATNPSALADPR